MHAQGHSEVALKRCDLSLKVVRESRVLEADG